jgi:hypothetical protein
MSIVRVGLAETKNFAEGYEAIFGKKKDQEEAGKDETPASKENTSQAEEKSKASGQ